MDKLKKVSKFIFLVLTIIIIYRLIGCPFRFFIGIPCPGCGVTRAWFAFINGRFTEAFEWHPLFLIAPAVLLAFLPVKERIFKRGTYNSVFFAVYVLLLIGVYAIRMYSMFPDSEPMTYNENSVIGFILAVIKN